MAEEVDGFLLSAATLLLAALASAYRLRQRGPGLQARGRSPAVQHHAGEGKSPELIIRGDAPFSVDA